MNLRLDLELFLVTRTNRWLRSGKTTPAQDRTGAQEEEEEDDQEEDEEEEEKEVGMDIS